jgi:hypothetical protein
MPARSKTSAKTLESEETLSKLIRGDKEALAERAAKGGNMPAGAHPDEKAIAQKYGMSVEQVRELNRLFKKGESREKAKKGGKDEDKEKAKKEERVALPWYARGGSSFYKYLFGGSGTNADSLSKAYISSGGGGAEGGSPLEQAMQEAIKSKGRAKLLNKGGKPATAPSGTNGAPATGGSAPSGGSSGGSK